jgi:hypothetical protein
MARRSTIGKSPLNAGPLDLVIPPKPDAAATKQVEPPAAEDKEPVDRITVSLQASVVERARTCVFWSPGETMATLVAAALETEVTRREKQRGEPFPPRKGRIRTGRPIRS